MMKQLSWWKIGGLAALVVSVGVAVAAILGVFNRVSPTSQVWVTVNTFGPTLSVKTTLTGEGTSSDRQVPGEETHATHTLPPGSTITVVVSGLDDSGDVSEETRYVCAIGDTDTGEVVSVATGAGKGTITCSWTRPTA